MDIKTMTSERFAEELFFLLMSSPLRDRVQTLGIKYGLSRKDLRDEIVLFGKGVGEQIYLSRRSGFDPSGESGRKKGVGAFRS